MSGGAGKRAKRGSNFEWEPIIAYDSDMCVQEFGELVECSFVQVSLYDFSPGPSSRAEVSMWYLDDQEVVAKKAKKSWPLDAWLQLAGPIIAYDSDMFSEELGWIHQCARVQVTLYDVLPCQSARISIKCRMFPDEDDDESEPVQNSAKSAEARAALRALVRAKDSAYCMNVIDALEHSKADNAITEFETQLDELDKDARDTEEHDDIIKTLKGLETFYKNKAAEN